MKLEYQVVSLDLSKRLKELGFKQESLFYFAIRTKDDSNENVIFPEKELNFYNGNTGEDNYYDIIASAYTVAELGEMMPYLNDNEEYYTFRDSENNWVSWESENGLFNNGKYIKANTEADSRAKMLIYLKENNLI